MREQERTEQRRQHEARKEELRKATEESKVHEGFSLNAAPGSVTELKLGNVPPLQFVYCPAGKFSMGYAIAALLRQFVAWRAVVVNIMELTFCHFHDAFAIA